MDRGMREGSGNRYLARKALVPVNFMCEAPDAAEVSVIGDFNEWNPEADRMWRHHDGCWKSSLMVHTGHHRYQFLVDGEPRLDPRANGVVRLEGKGRASLLMVS